MGRKKKEKKKEIIQAKTPFAIEYRGDVSIDVIRKGKVIKSFKNHNDGTNNLFRFILDCLAGNYYEVNRPFWIVPYFTDENKIDKYSISIPIPINNNASVSYDNSTQQYVLTYKCLINSSLLQTNTIIDGLLFYSTHVKKSITINAGHPVVDPTSDNAYSMKMSFGFDEKDREKGKNKFQDQDLLVTWQIRISSATQGDSDQSGTESTQN